MTKVKRTYTLHERELPYILSPANAIRALKLEYGRCRRTETSPAPSQERFRTGTFDIPIVSSHDIQSGKVVALGFHPQHYVVDSNGKVRSALPHQLEIRARKLLGQQRSEVVFQSDAALAEVQELMKDPYPISVTPAPSPTHTSQGPLPVKNKLSETLEEQGGLLNDIGDTAGAGALILAGGIADRLGFDEVADNAFGAATDLLEKPGSSGAKEEAVAVLGATLGAAKTVGDTLIGGAQLAGMAAQETAYDLLGGEQGLGSHIDSLQSNHENIEQIKASAGQAVKDFAQDIPGSLGKGIEAAGAAVDNVRSNVDSIANTESNVERLFASSKVGETAADTALTLTGAAGLVRGGIKTATKNVGAVTDGGTTGRMQVGSVVPDNATSSVRERVLVNIEASRNARPTENFSIYTRKETARQFYLDQGWEGKWIGSHIDGIDFTKPVYVDTLKAGDDAFQWQIPGAPQGNYYTPNQLTLPGQLGINPQAIHRDTGQLIDKVQGQYSVNQDVRVLRSTAREIIDDWSVSTQPYKAPGGGTQLFTTEKDPFKLQ